MNTEQTHPVVDLYEADLILNSNLHDLSLKVIEIQAMIDDITKAVPQLEKKLTKKNNDSAKKVEKTILEQMELVTLKMHQLETNLMGRLQKSTTETSEKITKEAVIVDKKMKSLHKEMYELAKKLNDHAQYVSDDHRKIIVTLERMKNNQETLAMNVNQVNVQISEQIKIAIEHAELQRKEDKKKQMYSYIFLLLAIFIGYVL